MCQGDDQSCTNPAVSILQGSQGANSGAKNIWLVNKYPTGDICPNQIKTFIASSVLVTGDA